MRLLLIDTCGAQGSVAIAEAGSNPQKIVHLALPGRSASEKLVKAVRDLAMQAGIALRDLDAVAVVHGPGSFTGVRVGLSAAKGFCEALNLPLIAISRLAVLASLAEPAAGARIVVALDAGRGELYAGEYVDNEKIREALVAPARLTEWIGREHELIVCEASVAQSLSDLKARIVREPDAPAALPLALARFDRKEFDDIATTDANYLRRTDLEILAKAEAAATISSQRER